MNPDDENKAAPPSKKPGLLRRWFGGLTSTSDTDESGARLGEGEAADDPAGEIAANNDQASPTRIHLEEEGPGSGEAEPVDEDGGRAADFAPALDEPEDLVPAHVPVRDVEEADSSPADALTNPTDEAKPNWWARLTKGLARSSSSLSQGIVDIFAKRKLDATTLEDLDDVLVRADLGVAMATRITEAVGKGRYNKTIDPSDVRAILADEIEAVLAPVAVPLRFEPAGKPFTILVIGVNGSGKTTTIGKLAAKFAASGKSVMLAAGDTFRAAAVEQLRVWATRTGSAIVAREQGADAAGLAFDALGQAREAGADILLIDTAGRLQNRAELMDELAKVIRVMRKLEPEAPHAVLLVLDATVGQNALSQVEIFSRVAGVTGLIMTKLDGTARGGILVAIAERFQLPVHFIGVGEGVDDLEPFAARDFARAIAGLD